MKTNILAVCRFGLGLTLLFTTSALYPQASQTTLPSLFTYLTKQECDTLSLEFDLNTLLKNRRLNTYTSAVLQDSKGQAFQVDLRSCGKFRRMRCEIPPLKLKFSKKKLVAAQFDTLNEIKLVFPYTWDAEGEALLLNEYLAYRMYEMLSPYSFRARLMCLRLINTNTGSVRVAYAMLIEHEEELLARLQATAVTDWGVEMPQLEPGSVALTALFQYLVGNTDWDIASQRNVLILRSAGNDKYRTIPYDFDFSGFVNAPYATPNSQTGLRTVQDRRMMAVGISPEALQQAVKTLLDAENALYDLCRTPLLSKRSAAKLVDYLGSFFRAARRSENLPEMMYYTGR